MNEITDDRSGDLLARWRQGDQQAATELVRRYADRLIALARSRLSGKLAARVDPEDIVQSVYRSFFASAREGRYDLQHGGDLWRLLLTIALNKLHDLVKANTRDKRSVHRERTFSGEASLFEKQAHLAAQEPSPVEAVALTEEVEWLMRRLEPLERRMLELRLQGYNLEEIAADTHRSERTVRRLLDEVKQQLEQRNHAESNT